MKLCSSFVLVFGASFLGACFGGGGGGGGGSGGGGNTIPESAGDNASEVTTVATADADGNTHRVDVVDGGIPGSTVSPNPALAKFLDALMALKKDKTTGKYENSGLDLDRDMFDLLGDSTGDGIPDPTAGPDGVPDIGFLDTYAVGMGPGGDASTVRRIFAANNAYDLFQSRTGTPSQAPLVVGSFLGYTGGDITLNYQPNDPDGASPKPDGGPGLFSNFAAAPTAPASYAYPALPRLPHVMGSGRGPSATDQHQFFQIEFPFSLSTEDLFEAANALNSFLSDDVISEARWVEVIAGDPVDRTSVHRHVSGVAVVAGMAAIPISAFDTTLAIIDPAGAVLSNVPAGALAKIYDPNVLTFIAHESPISLRDNPIGSAGGFVDAAGILRLPNPNNLALAAGGRVFGANTTVPDAVNDFATTGTQDAAVLGFVSFQIVETDTSKGEAVPDAYFHTFPADQSDVGADPRAPDLDADGFPDFTRGAAIVIDTVTQLPAIDILNPGTDVLSGSLGGGYNPSPSSDNPASFNGGNVISTRARFRVDFDKEVVPNSVGFSRRHTIHSTEEDGAGVIFPFSGNIRPTLSPSNELTGIQGAPLAPSIYLAINVPAGTNKLPGADFGVVQKVNSPAGRLAGNTFDSPPPGAPSAVLDTANPDDPFIGINMNGLNPTAHNTLATLPRGVVPCDIYPVNQNNLQSYIVEPLVEIPPGSVVTLGVTMPGLGFNQDLALSNHGNQTRSGTIYTPFQGTNRVGLSDDESLKQFVLPNHTILEVNAGAMDFEGRLFYGGTAPAIDIRMDGMVVNDPTTGGFNVARTFQVGQDAKKVYTNAPVSPQAMYLGYDSGGGSILDLSGSGFNTNKPGGANDNVGSEDYLVVSQKLANVLLGSPFATFNFTINGAAVNGDHLPAFGRIGRYGTSQSLFSVGVESDLALAGPIPLGAGTPTPGINEGSSGYQTLVRNSNGESILTPKAINLVRDIQVGDFLDILTFDNENPWAISSYHRTYNTPLDGSVANNMISDPPFPNPPPLRFPVGLPHTSVVFDQDDLGAAPQIIEGSEVFGGDAFVLVNDGSGFGALASSVTNTFIQLNPTTNASNTSSFDVPPLPKAGFNSPFAGVGGVSSPKFVQTGPMPKTCTTGALILAAANNGAPGTAASGNIVPPVYQTRQQIGNYLFLTDGVSKKVHAVNSNTMEIVRSIKLPDPYGLGLSPDLSLLFVSNEGDNSLSIIDADPRNTSTFMTEINRIEVGTSPRAVAVQPDGEDVFVCNFLGNTITIIDISSQSVRRTLTASAIDRPYDITLGLRETNFTGTPGFQSGTFHGFISNFGDDNVLVYESGPSGLAGIGFDNIIGEVKPNFSPPAQGQQEWKEMFEPRGVAYDPIAPLDTFGGTIGCFVAHRDEDGRGVITRIAYTKDTLPGVEFINTANLLPGFGVKVFETTSQYASTFAGSGLAVGVPDFNRERLEEEDFATFPNLLNGGGTVHQLGTIFLPRNNKYPLTDVPTDFFGNIARWEPDRVYLSMDGGIMDVFDIQTGAFIDRINLPRDATVLTTYFSQ